MLQYYCYLIKQKMSPEAQAPTPPQKLHSDIPVDQGDIPIDPLVAEPTTEAPLVSEDSSHDSFNVSNDGDDSYWDSIDPDEEWLDDGLNDSPEQQARSDYLDHLDTYMGYTPVKDQEDPTSGKFTAEEVQAWFDALPEDERQRIETERSMWQEVDATKEADTTSIREALQESAPELFEGKLPEDLAHRLRGKEYILGTHQAPLSTAEEAAEALEQSQGGMNIDSSLESRFLFFNSETSPDAIDHDIVNGYYGPGFGGRLVIAVPHEPGAIEGESISLAPDLLAQRGELPEDFLGRTEDGGIKIDSKYLAGFIDQAGKFHVNTNFMEASQVPWQQAGAESKTFDEV
jgi:hypothetical protein